MTDVPEFRIEHITDLAQIPEEHMDEALESLRMMCAQLAIIKIANDAAGQPPLNLRAVVPSVTIRCDGVVKSTARFPDGTEFVVERDTTASHQEKP